MVFFGCSQLRQPTPALLRLDLHSGSLKPSSPEALGPTGSGTHPPPGYGCAAHRAFLDLHSSRCLWSHVSLSCMLLGWCMWSRVCTLPQVLRIWTQYPPQPCGSSQAARWRGGWNWCCRRVPQSAPEGLFHFGKIFLLNPDAP